jgi:hypothetical protein
MSHAKASQGLKTVANAVAAIAAMLWLAFFVEHAAQWFSRPPWPPVTVWIAQAAHLGIFVGLLSSLRWRLAGSIATITCTLLFFLLTVRPPVPALFFPTIAPALLFLAAWFAGRNTHAQRLRA